MSDNVVDIGYLPNPFRVPSKPEESERDILVRSINNIMKTSEGRTVVWAMLSATDFFSEPLSNDPIDLARQQGQRYVGHWIINLLEEADPTSFARMQLEVAKRYELALARQESKTKEIT